MPRKRKEFSEPSVVVEQEPEAVGTKELEAPPAPQPARRFVSNTYPELGLGIKGQYYRFNHGELVTCDPDVIAAIESHPWFKIHIHNG